MAGAALFSAGRGRAGQGKKICGVGQGRAIRKASLLVRGRKRDSEEEDILKMVTFGGAWQIVSTVRIPLIPVRNFGIPAKKQPWSVTRGS